MRVVSAADAVSVVNSGGRVGVHSVAAAPQSVVNPITARTGERPDVDVCQRIPRRGTLR